MFKLVTVFLLLSLSLTSYSQETLNCSQLQVGNTDLESCSFLELFNSSISKAEKLNSSGVKIQRNIDVCDHTVRQVKILSDDNKVILKTSSYKLINYVSLFEGHMFVKIEDQVE